MMINKCLFPAAGYGTRFLPATKSMPKEMMPVIAKPLIHHAVEEAYEAGMNEICIITGRGKRAIEDYFDYSYELENEIKGSNSEKSLKSLNKLIQECDFCYTRQNRMMGLGHAVLTGRNLIGNESFGLILADDLCINTYESKLMLEMKKLHQENNCSVIAVMEVDESLLHKYGVIAGDFLEDGIIKVNDMIEKPSHKPPSNLAIIGRYILTPDIFNHLRQVTPDANGEIQLTDALRRQAIEGKVLAYKFDGLRFDCGCVSEYLNANSFLHEN